jgi:hypothetical protein
MPDVIPTALSADELNKIAVEQGIVEKKDDAPPRRRICMAMLSYTGQLFMRTHMCLMTSVMQCAAQGWEVSFVHRDNDSMVARGRNYLASQFLENPQLATSTDLVMIDTDLAWDGDEFVKLCSHPVDVIGGAYPFKDESGDFPLRWPPDGLMEENGLWQVDAVTPGFMRITRPALEKMARLMPWLQYKDKPDKDGQRSWMFFDNLQRTTGVYDEGYVFCERWRTLGGKVWCDPDLNITHIGTKAYNHGTLRQWLERKSATVERLESEYPGVPPLKLVSAAMTGDMSELEAEKASAA